ncbi:MAG: helix-turn-helix transcriptional regulator [Acidimicrobiales bacterium]
MPNRTSVFVYAADPLCAAGAKYQLLGEPSVEVLGPADVHRARVALVVADVADEAVTKLVRAVKRDGAPEVVLVASRFDEETVIRAVAAGVTSFLRRSDATATRLVDVIREADRVGCQLPHGLLRKAEFSRSVPAPEIDLGLAAPLTGRRSGASFPAAVATATELRLSVREAEILRLVADGYDTSDVASELSYSESTIKSVLAKLMTRLDARNRCHAVAIAVRHGLV